jgi:hypothetical protein
VCSVCVKLVTVCEMRVRKQRALNDIAVGGLQNWTSKGNARARNGELLSLNVVKQRHVIVRNTGENHVETTQGN